MKQIQFYTLGDYAINVQHIRTVKKTVYPECIFITIDIGNNEISIQFKDRKEAIKIYNEILDL